MDSGSGSGSDSSSDSDTDSSNVEESVDMYLRGWDDVKDLDRDKLLSAYRELLIKYNKIVIPREKKIRDEICKGYRCGSCRKNINQLYGEYECERCHSCYTWTCDDCIIDCPYYTQGCILCKNCVDDTKQCTNCGGKHCRNVDGICYTCKKKQCLTCKLIVRETLDMYYECKKCATIREETCGMLARVYNRRISSWSMTIPPAGCGKAGEKVNKSGLCKDCEYAQTHTCAKCKKVSPVDLVKTKCKDCYNEWYESAKCSRCNKIKSDKTYISQLGYCDTCFNIFEKCRVCCGLISFKTSVFKTTPPWISDKKGESKCEDCYTYNRQ